MTRRAFLKWMLSLAAAAAALGWLSFEWLGKLARPRETGGGIGETGGGVGGTGGGTGGIRPPNGPAAEAADRPPRQPEDSGPPLLSYAILSDLHINADDPNPSRHLREALDDLASFGDKVELVMITGDITDTGRDRDYREFRKILDGYRLPPYYANMGNHDYYNIWIDDKGQWNQEHMPNGKTDRQSRETFMKFFGMEKPYREVEAGGFKHLLLSQEAYVQERPEVGEGAWYSDEQLDWLRKKLEEAPRGRPIFVYIHQPLPPAGQDGRTHQLIRAREFRSILEPYTNVFVFCGHRHQDFENGASHYEKETFHLFHNSSVGRVLNRNYQQASMTKSQGLYIQVYRDKVVVRGREFSKRQWIGAAEWSLPLEA